VTEPFAQAVRAAAPRATLRPPLQPPEVGAALLGFKRIAEGDVGCWTLGTGTHQIRRSISLDDVP
jgi:hypothetical protein